MADEAPRADQLPFALQTGERPLMIARRHWAFFALKLGWHILVMVVPVAIWLWVFSATSGLDGTSGSIAWGVAILWLLFWGVKTYFVWYAYNRDVWVVTNQRVVDSRKSNWFNHQMASTDLVSVEDMQINKSGIFATAFKYGDLSLQTAGQQSKFVLSGIPEPADIMALIDQSRDSARRELRGVT